MNIRSAVHFFLKIKPKRLFHTKRAVLICVLFTASVLTFLICSGLLFRRLVVQPAQAETNAATARALYHGSPEKQPVTNESSSPPAKKPAERPSLSALRSTNSDVEGWVSIPDSTVDYPVLRAPVSSPDFYLAHDWTRRESRYGSIYMLPFSQASKSKTEKNTILYGHSMRDGTMFADLLKYDDLEFCRSHPLVQFQRRETKSDWKIFAVIKANTDPAQGTPFDYQKRFFGSDAELLNYLYEVRIRSVFNLPVDLKPKDSILTLSTCSYEFDGFRTVVFARKVREGEDSSADFSKAEKNSRALYPDCWYKKFGGTKPSPPSFQKAKKNRELPWLNLS